MGQTGMSFKDKGKAAAYMKVYNAEHKDERAVNQRKHYVKNKEKIHLSQRAYRIKRKYGLTITQYEELIANGCYVCGTMDNLQVDHDHTCCPGKITCGKCIRGCLCRNHNQAEGHFKTIEEIVALLTYRMQFENVLEMEGITINDMVLTINDM